MKKYELTSETKVINGVELHRIKALDSFGRVEKGELGGWIESEKNLSQDGNAWVGGNAKVCGNAWVGYNARVDRDAMVYENATVSGNATISGYATISGDAIVSGDATISGNAKVRGNASIEDYAKVYDNAIVSDNAMVYENATISGNATVRGYAFISGNAVVSDNADFIVFKNWWSSGRYFTWTRSNNKWNVGCFYGSGEELIAKAYKDSEKSGREYERVVKYVESILKEEKNTNN